VQQKGTHGEYDIAAKRDTRGIEHFSNTKHNVNITLQPKETHGEDNIANKKRHKRTIPLQQKRDTMLIEHCSQARHTGNITLQQNGTPC